jgi:hypothetical protein
MHALFGLAHAHGHVAAILSADGDLLAVVRAIWIELRDAAG